MQLLNQIVCELPPQHPVSNCRPLHEPLGHTPLQVLCMCMHFIVQVKFLDGNSHQTFSLHIRIYSVLKF